MNIEDAIFEILFFCFVALAVVMFIVALIGFIRVQIKAKPIWRLLSLSVVLVGGCWFCSFHARQKLADQYTDIYDRGFAEFVRAVDQMTVEGRTNDVHQSCQKLLDGFTVSTDDVSVSNFDQIVDETADLASQQSTTTAVAVSTNK
jgi:ABC-type transport system involved in cytochrome bd biosynthesis fused ATPase/permease subunit